MTRTRLPRVSLALLFTVSLLARVSRAQSETATISGLVTDTSGAPVAGAEVQLQSVERGTVSSTTSNGSGIYFFASVQPGRYRASVRLTGFRQLDLVGLIANVQDHIEQNFRLEVGSVSESVTVESSGARIQTEPGGLSTVVDRQFVANLPLNGRSFQSLIELAPGVVFTQAVANGDHLQGQFSVNGQRSDTNYFMVDGVSANVAINPGDLNQTAGGSLPALSVLGGTTNLVPVDAMQEFRIETSTYAPEFGRTPGGQVSIVTRSGTNEFHGTAFDYLRNESLDANDWFANQQGLPKPKERQNDFGGVLGGPLVKDRTFFFVSYEGLRLSLPRTGVGTVPALSARQAATAGVLPLLQGFPLPTGPEIVDASGNPTGVAPFSASYSDPAQVDSGSVRIDHTLSRAVTLFIRYSDASSSSSTRGQGGFVTLNTINAVKTRTQALTFGATWTPTATLTNDFRFNYTRNTGDSAFVLDSFGGAIVPSDSFLFPAPFSSANAVVEPSVFRPFMSWVQGKNASNLQRQLNIVDNLTVVKGKHDIKVGIDYRRLTPFFSPSSYHSGIDFADVASFAQAQTLGFFVEANRNGQLTFHSLSVYAQDSWKVTPRLTLAYGIRWEFDPPPVSPSGQQLLAIENFGNLNQLSLAPSGTPLWKTTHGDFAPRVGLAYQLSQERGKESVVRGGFGVFYDLNSQQVGDAVSSGGYPFGAANFFFTPPIPAYPIPSALLQPPSIALRLPLNPLIAFDPQLQLPYSLEWNVAAERALGVDQTASIAYVGAVGRRLIRQELLSNPNPNFGSAELVGNGGTSSYNALQIQVRRRLAHGLQALVGYTWSHSIDTASGSAGFGSDFYVRSASLNRGDSDFDVRHSVTAAVTFNIPAPSGGSLGSRVLRDWSIDAVFRAHSALPADVFLSSLSNPLNPLADVRPDVVPGVPFYIGDPSAPGGKRINPAAFTSPPVDPITGVPTRQGTLGRNVLRGFPLNQLDLALRREFRLADAVRLQFTGEFFNVFNHPNFGNPVGDLSSPLFGQAITMLGQSLGQGNPGAGAFSPLYATGGPRSLQLSLKLLF
jgi:hypothetical protein